MTPPEPTSDGGTGRLARRLAERAKESARILKDEFDKGASGMAPDEPTPVLWDRPSFEHVSRLVKSRRGSSRAANAETSPASASPASPSPSPGGSPGGSPGAGSGLSDDAAAAEVSNVLERIDWSQVSAATQSRGNDVADRLRSLTEDVDWDRMKPVAGKVATALIAAAATGHLGRLTGPAAQAVARAINGDQGVGEAAASLISRRPGGAAAAQVMKNYLKDNPAPWAPPAATKFSHASPIRVGDTEVIPAGGFEARLAELRDLAR